MIAITLFRSTSIINFFFRRPFVHVHDCLVHDCIANIFMIAIASKSSIAIMEAQLRVLPPETYQYHSVVMFEGFQGGLQLGP